MQELPLKQVVLTDYFWRYYQELIKETIIPYQYDVLNDALDIEVEAERKDDYLPKGKSHALENFRITAGKTQGEHFGWFFQDSDVYKWIEATSYVLVKQRDAVLEGLVDEVINLIGSAQEEDGYLNTYFQLKYPELKYRQLYFSHELYCAGHLIEAAIAYDQATGKKELLAIALKLVGNIEQYFGEEEGKIQGADGHQEIELALGRLYEHTGEEKYLTLAAFFIEVRGKDPLFYEKEITQNIADELTTDNPNVDLFYLQAYDQPKNQQTAQGHAVRMLYMAASMAKIANFQQDEKLLQACLAIWENITTKKMYVTGGVGSTVHGEAFTSDYDLPNDTMYCETCASIALVYFAYELYKIEPKTEYFEVIERAIYNGILSGASVDGTHFFYVNPLEVQPESCHHNPGKGHVKTQRPDWLGCACCPPNFARLIGSIGKYIYNQSEKGLWVNLFIGSQLKGEYFSIVQQTNFPYENQVKIYYEGVKQNVHIRIPKWLQNLTVTGIDYYDLNEGYLRFEAYPQMALVLTFDQPILSISSNPKVPGNMNKVSIQRGPFIYCAESIDNEIDLHQYFIEAKNISQGVVSQTSEILNQTLTIEVQAKKQQSWTENVLYQYNQDVIFESKSLKLIPYHLWGNRGETEMRVWLNC